MTDYDTATLMSNVREYAEGYPVKLGEEQPGVITKVSGGRSEPIAEPRCVLMALNEGGHNSVSIDVLDVLEWLVANRPQLVRDALAKHELKVVPRQADGPVCPPGFFCWHERRCPGCT